MMKAHTPREHWKNFKTVEVPADSSGAGALMETGGAALMQIKNPWTQGIGAALEVGGGIVDMIQARKRAREEQRAAMAQEVATKIAEQGRADSEASQLAHRALQAENQIANADYAARHTTAHSLATGGVVRRYGSGGDDEDNERPEVQEIPVNTGTVDMPYRTYSDPYGANHFSQSSLSFTHPSKKKQSGWGYNIRGNSADNVYSPGGPIDLITHNKLLNPILGLASKIAPFAVSAFRPVIGSYLGAASALYGGNPLGLAINAIPAITGTIASGGHPWNIKGPYDSLKAYWEGKTNLDPFSSVGRRNMLSGALYLAPLLASYTGNRKYTMPTIGSNGFY